MKKVFISRKLSSSSLIRNIIDQHTLVAKSLIEFSALDFEEPKADWIFFYSRNGVKYFFKNGHYELYPYLWACMSEGTADELSHYVTDISFIGNGSPKEVAQSYKNASGIDQITCFVRARNSLDSIHKLLDKANDFSLPVYNNTPVETIPTQGFDILVFTSPMNVDAWFNKREYDDELVISIGHTTANHLLTYGIKDVIVADSPSEASIAKCLQSVL